ncbi:MAG: saccharopine dehydrogenase NADP-binding domain-containing protein [Nanoarchaeota archaeon]
MQSKKYDGDILMIGYGGVARSTLPLIYRHIDMPHERITVMDFAMNENDVRYVKEHGSNFVANKVERHNLGQVLGNHVGPGDMVIDLAWNIGCDDILRWCHDRDVRYFNTSVEVWDPSKNANAHPTKRTLYDRHMKMRAMMGDWNRGGWKGGPTAILDHGANPGWVQHCTKQALDDIASRWTGETRNHDLHRDPLVGKKYDAVMDAYQRAHYHGEWALLAHALGIKTIHVSERDTQTTNRPKRLDEFVNTWSVEGFREEGTTGAEMGWGTHERALPAGAHRHKSGPKNQICLDNYGINTFVRTLVPRGHSVAGKADFEEIVGMVVRHGEAFSISENLTLTDEAGKVLYRPTVHYAYQPCDAALASLHELKGRGYTVQSQQRIMFADEIQPRGQDIMGCLLMGHGYDSWWIGSLLGIEETKKLLPDMPDTNPTTLQVAASVLAGVRWAIDNPAAGVLLPDHLPHDKLLPEIKEYLGTFISEPAYWNPLQHTTPAQRRTLGVTMKDTWQFTTFQKRAFE